jgi:hypothetical protein
MATSVGNSAPAWKTGWIFNAPRRLVLPFWAPPEPEGVKTRPQPGHQAEGAGVEGLQGGELLLPGLAQPAAAEVVPAQALVEGLPVGGGAVAVALGQGGGGGLSWQGAALNEVGYGIFRLSKDAPASRFPRLIP